MIKTVLRNILCDDGDDEPYESISSQTQGVRVAKYDKEPSVEITVRSSKELVQNNGRIPEEMAVLYIENALWMAGIGYEITYGFDHVNPPDEDPMPGGDAIEYYKDKVEGWDYRAEDSNVLLLNAKGGGAGTWWGEGVCTAPGYRLNERREWRAEGSDDWHGNIQSILHESLNHNLGGRHDHDEKAEGNQYRGNARVNEDRKLWKYTPGVFNATGQENVCGEEQPDPDNYNMEEFTKVKVHELSDCAVKLIKESL